jgi:hypothetical protein
MVNYLQPDLMLGSAGHISESAVSRQVGRVAAILGITEALKSLLNNPGRAAIVVVVLSLPVANGECARGLTIRRYGRVSELHRLRVPTTCMLVVSSGRRSTT